MAARLMLDLCSGLGGASSAMQAKGWRVITVDIEAGFNPSIVADVRQFTYSGRRPDLIWASPPCVEFARESMPWSRTGQIPDMDIVRACYRIVEDVNPRFWIIENVRGAIPYFKDLLGDWRWHQGAWYLWGFFPPLGYVSWNGKKKESYGSKQRAERAKIPYELSLAIANAIEGQMVLI